VVRKSLHAEKRKEKCKLGHSLVYVSAQKRLRCYECDKVRSKKYYAQNKGKIKKKARNRQLLYLYGITIKEYNNLMIIQNSKCAICNKHGSNLVVDHCHATGRVRGLLCKQCNFVLGLVNDNKSVLMRAAEYLD